MNVRLFCDFCTDYFSDYPADYINDYQQNCDQPEENSLSVTDCAVFLHFLLKVRWWKKMNR